MVHSQASIARKVNSEITECMKLMKTGFWSRVCHLSFNNSGTNLWIFMKLGKNIMPLETILPFTLQPANINNTNMAVLWNLRWEHHLM